MENFHIPGFIYAIGPVLVGLLVLSKIINLLTTKRKEHPKGSYNQKFSTFMKTVVPVGLIILVVTTAMAVNLSDTAYESGAVVLSLLGWAAFIGYTVFMYNKIYLKEENVSERKPYGASSQTKVETSTAKPKQEAESESKKKEMQWLEKAQSKIPKPLGEKKKGEIKEKPQWELDAEKRTLEKALSKIPKPMSQQKKEEIKERLKWEETKKAEPQEVKPKEILTWDKPTKPEPVKEEPVKEEPKPTEVTITPQEEESIYEQVAKELKENRSEGVWLKAYTENDGDETKTKIAYTKNRVTSLMKELKKNKTQ